MKVNLKVKPPSKDTSLHRQALGRGVPRYLFDLEDEFNLKGCVTPFGKTSQSWQITQYFKILKNPTYSNYLMVMGSTNLQERISILALHVLMQCLTHPREAGISPPYWYTLKSTTREPLLEGDNRVWSSVGKRPALMVFDGMYVDSNALKTERCRDLLLEYAHIPRILTVAGADPEAALKRLHLRADHALYLTNDRVISL